MISVFLDDEECRVPKEGWVWVKTPQEAVDLLKTGTVERISLDNDLGMCGHGPMTEGKHVADWIEAEAVAGRLEPIYVYIHTRNPAAKQQMKHAIANAKGAWRKRNPL